MYADFRCCSVCSTHACVDSEKQIFTLHVEETVCVIVHLAIVITKRPGMEKPNASEQEIGTSTESHNRMRCECVLKLLCKIHAIKCTVCVMRSKCKTVFDMHSAAVAFKCLAAKLSHSGKMIALFNHNILPQPLHYCSPVHSLTSLCLPVCRCHTFDAVLINGFSFLFECMCECVCGIAFEIEYGICVGNWMYVFVW